MTDRTQTTILESIGKLRRRWLQVRFVRHALQSLFYLLLVAALVLLVFPELGVGALALGLAVAAVASGAVAAIVQRPTPAAIAKAYDDAAGLKDHLSSSVELLGDPNPMAQALVQDAAGATGKVAAKVVYPYHMPREGWWLPVPALLIVAVLALQGLTHADPQPTLEELMPALAERVAELESILRPAKEEGRELSAKEQELLAELEQLRVTLGRKKLDKKDAMAEVSKLLDMFEQERELEKEKELQLKKAIKGLGEKNKELADQINQGDYQDALTKLREKMEELRKEIEEKKREGATPEELEALEEMLRELEEIEAALMQLLQIDGDLQMMDGAIEFLENFEGDLADLDGMDPGEFMKPCDCDDPGT
jgi:hypothetical protein